MAREGSLDYEPFKPETTIDVRPEDNATSEPQPDLIVLNGPIDQLLPRPQPRDLLLVVKIGDTTLPFDLGVKARLYARAAIAECWVVDLNGGRILVQRDPSSGAYRSVNSCSGAQQVAPLAAPQAEIAVAGLLPRPQ